MRSHGSFRRRIVRHSAHILRDLRGKSHHLCACATMEDVLGTPQRYWIMSIIPRLKYTQPHSTQSLRMPEVS